MADPLTAGPEAAPTAARLPLTPSRFPAQPPSTAGSRRPRLQRSTPELDDAERHWWQLHGEVEEKYCWVQTPAIQRLVRRRAVERITQRVPASGRILDVGCGTGWLSTLLARAGAAEVHGIDFSAEQVQRAREQAKEQLGKGVVHFHQIEGALAGAPELAGQRFDAVVMHALLHHLSDEEASRLLRDLASLSTPDCRVFIVEPILYPPHSTRRSPVRELVNRLILLPRMGRRSGLRRVSPHEAELTHQIDNRGDSPKETPFLPGELEQMLAPFLEVTYRESVLCFSFLVAKNLLLLSVTYPRLGAFLLRTYLPLTLQVERLLLRRSPPAIGLPVFELLECRFHRPTPAGSRAAGEDAAHE